MLAPEVRSGTKPLAADRLIHLEQAKHLLRTIGHFATRILAHAGLCDLPHLIWLVPPRR